MQIQIIAELILIAVCIIGIGVVWGQISIDMDEVRYIQEEDIQLREHIARLVRQFREDRKNLKEKEEILNG